VRQAGVPTWGTMIKSKKPRNDQPKNASGARWRDGVMARRLVLRPQPSQTPGWGPHAERDASSLNATGLCTAEAFSD
jgi:hypothetical protein